MADEVYTPSEEETRIIKAIRRRFDISLRESSVRRRQWRRNEQLVYGDHYAIFKKLDKAKSRIVLNLIFETVETIMPLLAEILPKPDVLPEPTQTEGPIDMSEMMEMAQKMEDGIYHQWRKAEADEVWMMALKAALIYGNSPIRMLPGEQYLDLDLIDIFSWFPDPFAGRFKKAQWYITAAPTYLTEIARIYGADKVRGLKGEGRLDQYRSFHLFPEQHRERKAAATTGNLMEQSGSADYGGTGELAHGDQLDQCLLIDLWCAHEIEDDIDRLDQGEAPAPRETYLHATIASDRLLVEPEDSDHEIGSPPFTDIVNYPQPNSLWGIGEPEQLESLNLAADVILSEAVDGAVLGGNPPIKATRDLQIDNPHGIKTGPRETIWLPTRASVVEWMQAKGLPPEMLSLPMLLMDMANSVSGVSDVVKGRREGAVTAASAIERLQQAAQSRIRFKEQYSIRVPLGHIYNHIARFIQNNVDEPVAFLKRDRATGDFRASSYSAGDFEGQKFWIRAGVPLTENKAELIQLLTELAPLLNLPPDVLLELMPSEIRDMILAVLNRKRKEGVLAGLDMEQLTPEEQAILQSGDEDAIMNLLISLQQRGAYSPLQQNLISPEQGAPGQGPAAGGAIPVGAG